jgi:hypothetical protein
MTGKERALRDSIRQQEEKIVRIRASIKETQRALDEYLASLPALQAALLLPTRDAHDYCGKILYATEKAAHAARKLINRDLKKKGKELMRRAYFCDKCEAWHLTTVPHWCPYPENETAKLSI